MKNVYLLIFCIFLNNFCPSEEGCDNCDFNNCGNTTDCQYEYDKSDDDDGFNKFRICYAKKEVRVLGGDEEDMKNPELIEEDSGTCDSYEAYFSSYNCTSIGEKIKIYILFVKNYNIVKNLVNLVK